MATLNVQDFGARGDGQTDDRESIQAAISEANEGDSIYFPATDRSYLVDCVSGPWPSGDHFGIWYDPNQADHANDLTFRGDGRKTVIKTAPDQSANHFLFSPEVSGDTQCEIRELTIDGNQENIDTDTHRNIGLRPYTHPDNESQSHDVDILIENVWTHNCGGGCIEIYVGGVTINRCTSWNTGYHGFNFNVRDPMDPPAKITNSYAYNCDGYGIDASNGTHVIEDCVVENNASGIKNTANTLKSTWRRVRVKGSTHRGYSKSGGVSDIGQRHDVIMDDCIFEHNGSWGIVTSNSLDLTLTGTIVAHHNDASRGIYFRRSTDVDGRTAQLVSHDNSGVGLGSEVDGSHSVRLGTYVHLNNGDGPLGNTDQLQIDDIRNSDDFTLPSVPTADEVGAGTADDTDADPSVIIRTTNGTIPTVKKTIPTN